MANANKLTIVSAFEIDRLGTLLAQISDLTKQADAIKASLKELGEDVVVEGSLFRATVTTSSKVTLDADKVRLALGAAVSLCEKTSTVTTVRVVSR